MVARRRTCIFLWVCLGLWLGACHDRGAEEQDTVLVEVHDGDQGEEDSTVETDISDTPEATDAALDLQEVSADSHDAKDTGRDEAESDIPTGPCGGATCAEYEFCVQWDYACGADDAEFASCWPKSGYPEDDTPGCGCDGVVHSPASAAPMNGINLQDATACGPIPEDRARCGPLLCDPSVEFCRIDELGERRYLYLCERFDTHCASEDFYCGCYGTSMAGCDCYCYSEFINGQARFFVSCRHRCLDT